MCVKTETWLLLTIDQRRNRSPPPGKAHLFLPLHGPKQAPIQSRSRDWASSSGPWCREALWGRSVLHFPQDSPFCKGRRVVS